MDGDTLSRDLRMLLNETSGSLYLDDKTTYDYLNWAATDTAIRTDSTATTQTITTVADTASYTLNGDFIKLYLTDDKHRYFIKYYDGTNYHFIYHENYDNIILADNTTSVSIPSCFTIRQGSSSTQMTGAATSDGAVTNGECNLTSTTSTFGVMGGANPIQTGDIIHNTTDGSQGVIMARTSATVLVTALFGGTNNDWTNTDAYVLNPQPKFLLQLDPPSSTAGHTITVYYIQKPFPVYSPFRRYNFPLSYRQPLVQYAAWLYKYKDRELNYGDAFYKYWDRAVRTYARNLNDILQYKGYRVSLIKRAGASGSYRR